LNDASTPNTSAACAVLFGAALHRGRNRFVPRVSSDWDVTVLGTKYSSVFETRFNQAKCVFLLEVDKWRFSLARPVSMGVSEESCSR
jgi:hypothetical protein